MDIGTEAGIFLAYTTGMLLIYFFGRMMLAPLKKILKLMINSIIGGLILMLINILGAGFGIAIPINMITALIAGLLGLPGIVMTTLYFNFMI